MYGVVFVQIFFFTTFNKSKFEDVNANKACIGLSSRINQVLSSVSAPIRLVRTPPVVDQRRSIMSYCAWSKGEVYKDHFETGMYVCTKCDNPLFKSASKYAHSTPWPAFTEPVTKESLKKKHETETCLKVSCGKCGAGLGHQFLLDGPTKGSSRF